MIQSGTVLAGRYEILNLIGSGGMADVYRAKCQQLNRFVAVKVLRKEHNEDEDFVRRFIAEAQATAGFTHPNIVSIYDAGEDQGYHYIIMELCEGTTLKKYIRRYGRLSARETVDYAKKITLGIQAAHREGIVHRDIKPQNILVSQSGVIKVADFGIARAATGATIAPNLMGSVHYFSPEQARGGFADERSDIYSLGISMYEMATGRVPFDGETPVAIALMHLNEEITPPRCYFPDIPVSLEKIILKCTMKRPAERYQNAADLLKDLDQVFDSPDGGYVEDAPLVDDSPTMIQPTKEIKPVEEEKSQSPSPEEDNMEDPVQDEETEEDDDDEALGSSMKILIYVIVSVSTLLLLILFIYLIGSSKGFIHIGKKEEATEVTTEASTEAAKNMVVMPDVLKSDRVSAEKTLKSHNLKARFTYEEDVTNYDTQLIVVKQEYNPGTEVEEGSTVELTLGLDPDASTDAKRVEVPLVVNMTDDAAVETLEALGFEVKMVYATSDTVEMDHVIKQNPVAGTEVEEGFTVTITISKGVSQVRVPTITGLSQEEARKELNRVGLNLGEVTSDYNGSVSVGEVFKQGIDPGTMVDRGTSVSVVISLGDNVSYHYEGSVYFEESPLAEGESGTVELAIDKGDTEETIYMQENMTVNDFPFHYVFEADEEGTVEVILYVNGEEYGRQTVEITAVED